MCAIFALTPFNPMSSKLFDFDINRNDPVYCEYIVQRHRQRDAIRLIKGVESRPSKDPKKIIQPVFVTELWEPLDGQELFPK